MRRRRREQEPHDSRPLAATKAVKAHQQPLYKEIDMNAVKNAIRTMLVAAAVVLSASAHAQNCSGGPDGGMDATGNQCSHSNPVAGSAATPRTIPAARTGATSRSVAAASQVAHRDGAAGNEQPIVTANRAAQPARGPESAPVTARAVKVSKATGAN